MFRLTACAVRSGLINDYSMPRKVKPGPAKAPEAAVARSLAAEGPSNLKSRLTAAVNGRRVIAAGAFHLVGLAEIRERLGIDWERVRDKVHAQARRVIERRLSPRDVYFPGGPDDYVIVFAEMGKATAQLVCAKITQEVQQTLLGDSETQDISVRTVVSETDGSLRMEKAKLSEMVAEASAASMAADPPAPAGSDMPPMEPADQAVILPFVTYDEIVYRPMWDVRREALTTYLIRRTPGISGMRRHGASPEEAARLDLQALSRGIEALTNLYRNEFRLRLVFPMSFEAISSLPRFRTYIAHCRTIPEVLRQLIAFELIDLPTGVPNGRLAELASALRPFCGLVIATVDWWRTDLAQYANTGIRMVNAVIAPGSAENRILPDMDRFARDAERAGLFTSVEGITTSSLAIAAKGAGVGFLSGDRIGACVAVPAHMLRFTWPELYSGKSINC